METKLREVERFKITDEGEGPFTRVKVVVAISSRFHRHSKIPDTLQNNDHNNLSVCRGPSFPALLRTRQQQQQQWLDNSTTAPPHCRAVYNIAAPTPTAVHSQYECIQHTSRKTEICQQIQIINWKIIIKGPLCLMFSIWMTSLWVWLPSGQPGGSDPVPAVPVQARGRGWGRG